MVDYYPSTVAGFDGLGHVTVRVWNPSGVQDTAMISMIGIKLRDLVSSGKSGLIVEKNNDRKYPIRYGK